MPDGEGSTVQELPLQTPGLRATAAVHRGHAATATWQNRKKDRAQDGLRCRASHQQRLFIRGEGPAAAQRSRFSPQKPRNPQPRRATAG